MHVSEFRMPISQVLNLCIRLALQTVIPLAHVTLPVLPLAVDDAEDSKQAHTDLTSEVDGVASWVAGRI